ncbi:MAG: Ribosomal large subunit pseudouridine synthase D [Firmicutes bacterium ADurb.Bin146]|nr:MAG: Ribosomal large subunit pseudouridine synthase D [Firmicutes bacterium ADurb.Bin146]
MHTSLSLVNRILSFTCDVINMHDLLQLDMFIHLKYNITMIKDEYDICIELEVQPASHKRRLSSFLRKEMGISGNCIRRAKTFDNIFVDGQAEHTDYILSSGQLVGIVVPDKVTKSIIPSADMKLDILYEDDYLLALNKPYGILCHPIMNIDEDTLANGLKFKYPNMGIHPVSRLDRDTTGIVIYAKNSIVHHKMSVIDIDKKYIGMVIGYPDNDEGTINMPIARVPDSAMLRCFDPQGKPSVTHYKILYKCHNAGILLFTLTTGRTHQIRVHCKESGFPIIHDTLYGIESVYDRYIKRQALHSYQTSFTHPFTNEFITITSPLHEDMQILQNVIKENHLLTSNSSDML